MEPPRRPNKSRLRTMTDGVSNSSGSIRSEESPTSSNGSRYQSSPTPGKYASRFTEHFETKDVLLNEYIISPLKPRPDMRTSKSLSSTIKKEDDDDLHLPLDHLLTTSTLPAKRAPLTSSISTPLQIPNNVKPRKFGSNGSILTNASKVSLNPLSLNRAEVIITRYESWLIFLKSITNWVEEVSKITITSSRGYYQRAYPHLDESSAISTTTTTTNDASTLVQQNVNQSILTVQAGFQVLTMHIAAEQQAFSKCLERDHLPSLNKLRKECKEKIHKLKSDHGLALDELLRRAEVTRSKMTHLSRCCKQADKAQGQLEMDPWVANLLVLRQLKKEVDEENRLRLLMIPIQQDAQAFEKRLLDLVKPTVQYCYETLAPGMWDGTDDKDTAPFSLLMDQIMPNFEWDRFAELQKKDLVNEKHPTKDYLRINYPNKFHPMVMTLLKGKMERKYGVRKQFTERNYVLSQGGYLHQFTMDDKVSPEKTLYIPSTTIIPSIDISQISSLNQDAVLENTLLDNSNTFEVCKPASNVLQRDKVAVFRTSNRQELIKWCRLLIHFSSGVSLQKLGVVENDVFTNHSSSSSFEVDSFPIPKKLPLDESPTLSLRSVKTEESFNEPLIMNKTNDSRPPITKALSVLTDDGLKTPTATSFQVDLKILTEKIDATNAEDGYNNTDAESFVTANFNNDADKQNDGDNDDDDDEDNNKLLVESPDSFTSPIREDDTVSIASTSTARGPNSRQTESPVESLTPEFVSSAPSIVSTSEFVSIAPSIASTNFDDAQSSLYFSSGSAPTSPVISSQSSIVSIPDYHLVPEVTSIGSSSSNNTQLSPAQQYKADLAFKL